MNDKEKVAFAAADLVEDGMLVGLGTGSTADCFILELAHRVKDKGLKVSTVASSIISMIKARTHGLDVIGIDQIQGLDIYVDGADEVTPENDLLKGQGSDLVKEKILASASDQFIVLVDASKLVGRIGEKFAIPIEVDPFAWQMVKKRLEDLGAKGDLRTNANGAGFFMSSYGSLVLDMQFDHAIACEELNHLLYHTPGVVEHGIFYQIADKVLLAKDGQVVAH